MNFFKTKKYSLAGGTKSKSKVKKETKKKEGVIAISETEKYQVNRHETPTKQKDGKKKKAPAPPQPAAMAISEEPQSPIRTTEKVTLEDSHRVLETSNDIEADGITRSSDIITDIHDSTGERDTAKENNSITAESDATDFSDGHVSKELEALANEQSQQSSSAIEIDSEFPSTDLPPPMSSLYEDIQEEYFASSNREVKSDPVTLEESSRMWARIQTERDTQLNW